jgi:RNA polymerase sigma-70 factor (ECF subfamily)
MTDQADTALDDALVERCLQTKEAASTAFDQLYERHADAVLAFLFGLHKGDEHAARDALQETFFRFYNALGSLQPGRPLRPWLYRIGRNVSLDYWKHKSRRSERVTEPASLGRVAATGTGPLEEVTRKETAGILRRAIYALPPEELAVFLLRYDQGLPFADVAESLSCSLRTAKYRMKAAMGRIGRDIERMGVEA